MVPPGSAADAVDHAQLAKMGTEIGEHALREYVARYCALLGDRVERIAQAAAGDTADALRAALDLYVSSDMLGARRLAAAAADAAAALRGGAPVAPGELAALRAEAGVAGAVLRRVVTTLGGSGPGSGPGPRPAPGEGPGSEEPGVADPPGAPD